MRIEVFVTGWEQQCCGTPFGVGDEVTWAVVAEDPARSSDGVPAFREEHHEQTPPHVPHLEVTGTVASITGLHYVVIPEPGHSRSFIQTSTVESSQPVAHTGQGDAAEPDATDFDDYRVELDIADDTVLPHYAPPVTEEVRRRDEERRSTRREDAIGVMLTSLADYAESHFGHLAKIDRAAERHAVTVDPHRDGAAAIHWIRSDLEDFDGIHVEVGDGSWTFPASVTAVATLASFLDAAADGRVEELVASPDAETRQLLTVISSEDSETWTATVTVEMPSAKDGSFFVVGTLWDRIHRGERRYEPWAPTGENRPT